METKYLKFNRSFNIAVKFFISCMIIFILMGVNVKVSHAEDQEIQSSYSIEDQGDWKIEPTENGKVRIFGFSEGIDLDNLIIPSSINEMPVEINLKEVFGEILRDQVHSFTIEHSKEGLQPVRLIGDFNSLFAAKFTGTRISSVDFGDADTSNITGMELMFRGCSALKSINLGKNFNTVNVRTMEGMFDGCYNLNSLNLEDNFNTANVKNMDRMFSRLNFKKINLGEKFDTSNVENMDNMFSDCDELKSLDLGNNFNTENVQSMNWMFYGCKKLTNLDLGENFDTKNVTSMRRMFSVCISLTKLDLGELFDTSKVSNINGMFSNNIELKEIDLGKKFDTSNVQEMSGTFAGCKKLEDLNLGEKFKTSNVRNMEELFWECKSLTDFGFLENFDTSKVELMTSMFQGCLGIDKLTLNFDTQKVLGMSSMFSECTNLRELVLGEKFDSKSMVYSTSFFEQFKNCKNLTRLTIPGSFKLDENSNLLEVPATKDNYYWSYKNEQPMTTKQLLNHHNTQPADSLNTYELKKAYQVSFDTTAIPDNPQFSEKVFWENETFKEIPKDYKKEGYEIQWIFDNKPFDQPILMTKSIVVLGKATPILYKITFDSSGGEKVKSITYTIQDSVELPVPKMQGHKFIGWYDGSESLSEIVMGTTGNKNLSAKWTIDKSTLENILNKEEKLQRSAANYTYSSWEKYSHAIESGKTALGDDTITIEEFTKIQNDLLKAIKGLKELEKESVLSFEGLSNRMVEIGSKFDPKEGVKAKDSVEGDLTKKIKISGTVDTSRVGVYSLKYSFENSTKKKLEKEITVQVIKSSTSDIDYYSLEIPDLTLPKYSDYKQVIKEKMIIKNSKGDVVPPAEVDFSITSEGNTNKIGEISALITIPYPNGIAFKSLVKITVISGIEIVQPDIEQLHYVGDKKDSFDPYSVFEFYEIGIDGEKTKLGKYNAEKDIGVEILDNPVDFSKSGEYTVRYRITNSFGEKIEHSYVVTINPLKNLVSKTKAPLENANSQKNLPNTVVKKKELPKTGSEQANYFPYIIAFLLFSIVWIIKKKEWFHS